MENSADLLKFVNTIFEKKGVAKVTNLAKDFSDGCKYLSTITKFPNLNLFHQS